MLQTIPAGAAASRSSGITTPLDLPMFLALIAPEALLPQAPLVLAV